MQRIRTIKPEFFKHDGFFDAEQETGLPLRLAFAGLWTCCDREGRFEWKTRALKVDILPYDDVDFSRVLDALVTRGFVVKYRTGERAYGVVPRFLQHQSPNNREAPSRLPPPPEEPGSSPALTREERVAHASGTRLIPAQAEGKGREWEEKTSKEEAAARRELVAEDRDASRLWTDDRLREEVMAAVGIQGPHIPTHWMPPAASFHVGRWRTDLALDEQQIIEAARVSRTRYKDPPQGPKGLDGVMSRLAAELQAVPLRPETRGGTRSSHLPSTQVDLLNMVRSRPESPQ